MVDKTEILKNEVDRILSDQGKSTICILINTDDYSGKFVKLAGEKLLLIDETDFIADNVCDSLERRMIEKYGLSKNNVEDLVSKGSEVNRELKRYIKSNRIINSILVGKMSCQTAEDELAEVKGNLTILVQQIQELIVIKNFQDICYLIYGKMSGNYLIERYLRESLSYDADLEEENREEYHAVYVNPATGDKVVVVITPVSDEAGVVSNHIELIAGNSMDNDIVNRGTIHNVVSAKLREGGIQDMHLERCAGRHGDQLQQVIDRAGDIEAVAAGDERVRVGVPDRESGLEITERIHRGTTY